MHAAVLLALQTCHGRPSFSSSVSLPSSARLMRQVRSLSIPSISVAPPSLLPPALASSPPPLPARSFPSASLALALIRPAPARLVTPALALHISQASTSSSSSRPASSPPVGTHSYMSPVTPILFAASSSAPSTASLAGSPGPALSARSNSSISAAAATWYECMCPKPPASSGR